MRNNLNATFNGGLLIVQKHLADLTKAVKQLHTAHKPAEAPLDVDAILEAAPIMSEDEVMIAGLQLSCGVLMLLA